MNLFDRRKKVGGFMDVIRCDEPSYLIWKWHPVDSQAGNNNRENAVRWGSPIRVKDGEVAVFVYDQLNGVYQDFVEGPYDNVLNTENLPIIANIIGLAYDGGSPFQAEVYFINLARIIQVRFGVPFFDVCDPRFLDFTVPVAVRGTINFRIDDYREFIKLHRLSTFSLEDFEKQIRDSVIRYVKDAVANAPAIHNIPVVQLESKIAQINDAIEYNICQRLNEDFGVEVSGVDIGAIEIDKSSEGYAKLMAITQTVTSEMVKAQAAVNIKQMQDNQRIEAENYSETLRIQREEAQYAQRKQIQTTHFTAYQTEMQAKVGVAGADALGKMGASGASGVDLGGSNTGFNPATMMAGMAIGSAVGQNVAGIMGGMISNVNQTIQTATTPPPIPAVGYYVAINNQATGPFNLDALKQMAINGQIVGDSLVWKPGMSDWKPLNTVSELSDVCECAPPVINK